MNEMYVHTLRYRYFGRNHRRSRIMFPVSYGPFKDEDVAREWIRQRGLTCSTKLVTFPAAENIKVSQGYLIEAIDREQGGFMRSQGRHNPAI